MLRWETRGRTAAPVPAGPDDREMPAVDTAPVPFVNRRAGARSSGGRGATPWTDPPTLTAPAPSDGIARGRRLSALRRGAAAPAAEPVIRRTRVDALARAELDGEDASQRLLDLLRDPKTPEDRRRELVKANNDGLAETDLDYIDLDRLGRPGFVGGYAACVSSLIVAELWLSCQAFSYSVGGMFPMVE